MILLGITSEVRSQSSDSLRFNLFELKSISKLLTELDYRRAYDRLNEEKIKALNNVVDQFVLKEENYIELIEEKDRLIAAVKPAWYDKFYVGFGSAAIFGILIVLLLR